MLTVIIEAARAPEKLPPLLAQLTAGAVEGLVRQVILVARRDGLVEAICADSGADAAPTLAAAMEQARGPYVLALPAAFRFREGWIEAITGFLASGGKAARVRGQGGLFAPAGVLVERGGLGRAADLQGLRRHLGIGVRHIG